MTDGAVTGTMVPGATLIPNAYGLAGFNLHTWTGAWGTVSYWNAFVATLEMHGVGRFFDPRLTDAAQFPIAAAFGFGNLNATLSPDDDRVADKLPALHFYQLALPAPTPQAGRDFDAAAAKRGDDLFSGKAGCNDCREEGLFMTPANKGRFYHDGRFRTLLDVVDHYNACKSLGLTDQEKHDLVEYLKSLPES